MSGESKIEIFPAQENSVKVTAVSFSKNARRKEVTSGKDSATSVQKESSSSWVDALENVGLTKSTLTEFVSVEIHL